MKKGYWVLLLIILLLLLFVWPGVLRYRYEQYRNGMLVTDRLTGETHYRSIIPEESKPTTSFQPTLPPKDPDKMTEHEKQMQRAIDSIKDIGKKKD